MDGFDHIFFVPSNTFAAVVDSQGYVRMKDRNNRIIVVDRTKIFQWILDISWLTDLLNFQDP